MTGLQSRDAGCGLSGHRLRISAVVFSAGLLWLLMMIQYRIYWNVDISRYFDVDISRYCNVDISRYCNVDTYGNL